MILWFIAAIVILLTVSVLAFVIPSLPLKEIEDSASYSLEGGQVKAIPTNFVSQFTKNEKATFRVFYYLNSLPRTGISVDDATLVESKYNIASNSFDICPLNTSSNCLHPGFINLLQFGDAIKIELLNVPDASRPGLPKAQFVIKTIRNTNSNTDTQYLETFPLPAFPMQKWVMITLTRQGSQFTVYYNGNVVGSFRTSNAPSISSESGFFGDNRISGVAKYLKTTNYVMSSSEVNADHKTITDTRGEPIQPFFSGMNISLCPSGDCFRGPDVKPANPYISWQTDYM